MRVLQLGLYKINSLISTTIPALEKKEEGKPDQILNKSNEQKNK